MSEEQPVLVDVADGVMTVTLNRPKAKNAANKALSEGVAAAMDELDGNDDIRVAILTGAGGTFCAGMDLKAFVSGEMPMVEGRGFAGLTEAPPAKPLIAAVEGFALAGGLELMISCDLVVAADNAKFGIPEVKRGLAAAGHVEESIASMLELNRAAAEAMLDYDIHACTDVTGFGLLGHLREMTAAADLDVELDFEAIPFIEGVRELAARDRRLFSESFIFEQA